MLEAQDDNGKKTADFGKQKPDIYETVKIKSAMGRLDLINTHSESVINENKEKLEKEFQNSGFRSNRKKTIT